MSTYMETIDRAQDIARGLKHEHRQRLVSLRQRRRSGWAVERAITQPVDDWLEGEGLIDVDANDGRVTLSKDGLHVATEVIFGLV